MVCLGRNLFEFCSKKANARPGEDRAFFSPLSEPRGGGGDRFLGKPQPLRPRLSALLIYVAMLSKVSTAQSQISLTKTRSKMCGVPPRLSRGQVAALPDRSLTPPRPLCARRPTCSRLAAAGAAPVPPRRTP